MKKYLLACILITALIIGGLPVNVLGADTSTEKRFDLKYYDAYFTVSNVVSDNYDEYIVTEKYDSYGEIYQITYATDMFIEATAPCKVTFCMGNQYIQKTKMLEDGTYEIYDTEYLDLVIDNNVLLCYKGSNA